MKLHEEILDVLGEIDDDLLPERKSEHPRRNGTLIRWAASVAAVVIAAFGGLWLGRQTAPDISIPGIAYAADIVPRYLMNSRTEQILASGQFLSVAQPTGITREPQIYLAETSEEIVLPAHAPFTDTDGRVWQMYTMDSAASDALERNLRTDLSFANYIRDYGCVLWRIAWDRVPSEVQYLGIVPLIGEEDAVHRLQSGNYLTTVPASELPAEGITEERIGHRTLVYLLSPEDVLIRIYECFFVRLTDSENAETRWGLYYVPVTNEEKTDALIEKNDPK